MNEKEFLVAMIRELEEQLRIELRKKTILKAQCDQAYLRGVSAISMEALKMSQSTLKDFYSGLKMTTFDGSNIYTQIRKMNEEPVGATSLQQNRIVEIQTQQILERQGGVARGTSATGFN